MFLLYFEIKNLYSFKNKFPYMFTQKCTKFAAKRSLHKEKWNYQQTRSSGYFFVVEKKVC